MNTPICDFVRSYMESDALRVHMPGHKGKALLGMEQLDITEFDGADSLYEATGIIRQSQENARALFGARTFYSTEGSSQCIRAMLYLALLHGAAQGKRPLVAAARNVHKTFLSAAALLDLQVLWLYPRQPDPYLSCNLTAGEVDAALTAAAEKPVAVYLTSPDYLGNTVPIEEIARVCHQHGVLLLVDCAHGAYLRFLQPSRYPTDLGADLCCSSAHKTLPVLTGGAYLHLGDRVAELAEQAQEALMLFGSTSPSYLILQSLDAANAYLAADYPRQLEACACRIRAMKQILTRGGYTLLGDEPLKLTVCAREYGYTGDAMAGLLLEQGIVCEFHDPDYLVMMLTPQTTEADMERLTQALLAIPRKPAIAQTPPAFHRCQAVMSSRRATLSPRETVPVANCVGRVLAAPSVGCPPAVPIVICGERIDEAALQILGYYGITSCTVIRE